MFTFCIHLIVALCSLAISTQVVNMLMLKVRISHSNTPPTDRIQTAISRSFTHRQCPTVYEAQIIVCGVIAPECAGVKVSGSTFVCSVQLFQIILPVQTHLLLNNSATFSHFKR